VGDLYSDYENNLRQQYDMILNGISGSLSQQAQSGGGSGGGGGSSEVGPIEYTENEDGSVNRDFSPSEVADPFGDFGVSPGDNYTNPDITLKWDKDQQRYVPTYTMKPTSPAVENVRTAGTLRERLSGFRSGNAPMTTPGASMAENAPLTPEENMLAEMVRKGQGEQAMEYIRGTYPGKGVEGIDARGQATWQRVQRAYSNTQSMRDKIYEQHINQIVQQLPKEQQAEAKRHYIEQVSQAAKDPKATHQNIIDDLNAIKKEQSLRINAAKTNANKTKKQKTEDKSSNKKYVEKRTNEQGEYKPGETLVRGLTNRREGYGSRGAWAKAMRSEGFSEAAILAAAERLDKRGIQ